MFVAFPYRDPEDNLWHVPIDEHTHIVADTFEGVMHGVLELHDMIEQHAKQRHEDFIHRN